MTDSTGHPSGVQAGRDLYQQSQQEKSRLLINTLVAAANLRRSAPNEQEQE